VAQLIGVGPVTDTAYRESPPVWLTQAGACAPVPARLKRAAVSQVNFGSDSRPVVTATKYQP
jgi:hypothetical protein